jgi:membrane-bound lytic murein transglycosylase D
MRRVGFIIVFGYIFIMNVVARVELPWDSLFASYGLSNRAAMLPAQICGEWDLMYNDGRAAGIWGLTPPVARRYGLVINDEMDERYDLRLSTEVAARYLCDLKRCYGSEEVAILAYLNGAPLVADVAKMCGVDLWCMGKEKMDLLCCHLPKNGICDDIEVNCIGLLDSIYNRTGYVIYKFDYPIRKVTLQDSIGVELGLMNGMILPSARWINKLFVPVDFDLDNMLIGVYDVERLAMENELRAMAQEEENRNKVRAAAIKKANEVKVYVVKSGDTLGHIAKKHRVTVKQLKHWNGLKSDFLRIGQKLKIKK